MSNLEKAKITISYVSSRLVTLTQESTGNFRTLVQLASTCREAGEDQRTIVSKIDTSTEGAGSLKCYSFETPSQRMHLLYLHEDMCVYFKQT